MSGRNVAAEPAIVLAVSCAGGMARQYRVQVCDRSTSSSWQLAGSFRDSQDASLCAERLRKSGRQARVVACQALPTAA